MLLKPFVKKSYSLSEGELLHRFLSLRGAKQRSNLIKNSNSKVPINHKAGDLVVSLKKPQNHSPDCSDILFCGGLKKAMAKRYSEKPDKASKNLSKIKAQLSFYSR